MMTDFSHSPATVSTSKRTACDRCRGHKLRCPPREFIAQPCGRCTRLGVHCVTTFQCPVGRPGKNGITGHPRRLSQPELTPTSVKLDIAQIPLPAVPSQPVGDYEGYLLRPARNFSPSINAFDSSSLAMFSPLESQYPCSEELDINYMNYSTPSESLMSLEIWPIPDYDSNVFSESMSPDTGSMHNHIQTQSPCILQRNELSSHLNLSLSACLEEHPPSSNYPTSNLSSLGSNPSALAFELSEQWGSQIVDDLLHDSAEVKNL
ncbi:hypothetical protein F5Y09DRAFT_325640 [Xylaria sp. FL1042]|nr:hypothetical protein F5Y09DRAFT_325640 [Xylaria sp. FL1042]